MFEELTGPAGPYPLRRETVGGVPMAVFDRAPRTLGEAFAATREHGDRTALVYAGERWTYADQWSTVTAAAGALRERFGVGPGDRVAIGLRNYPEWVFTFWAAQLLGAVVVPLNAWHVADELRPVLEDCRPAVLVADDDRLDRTTDLHAAPWLRGVVGVRATPRPGVVQFEELLEGRPITEPAPATPEDVATILYTSGTTGRPKGVLGTHRNHTTTILSMGLRAEAELRQSPTGEAAATLIVFPLFHIAGLTLLTGNAFRGSTIALMYRWDPAAAVRLVRAEGIRDLVGPPTVVAGLLDAAGGVPLPSLRRLGFGGALAPPRAVAQVAETYGAAVKPSTGYGLTETTSAVVALSGPGFVERPTSIGRPLPTVEVRVVDQEDRLVRPGEVGELHVRGPQVAAGYHGLPAETAAAFRDGWFRTGDLVTVDDDGFLHLAGRQKDVIIRGGENVYCEELEAVLDGLPGVRESAVLGRPHEVLGEEVCAVVRVGGEAPTAADLRALLGDRMAAFKVPSTLVLTDRPLPRTATGKIVKAQVRAEFATELAGA
ncbi:class I adenylate-forming enzyme family protein [Pseudonocardia sp. NPDC049154]|uniref:class I adenylate-forming enzyme family protein n=1 Tax=Pseudonocardia sp. NPDC049154 TaxID=3155501 RepID=UPI0033FD56D1